MKFKELFIKYKFVFGIGLVLLLFFLGLAIFNTDSGSIFRRNQRQAEKQVDELHKQNKELLKQIQQTKDSVALLHSLARKTNAQDTVYINQIKYLKTKTNEEISHLNSLTIDSQYVIFSDLLTEYSKTRFNQDTF